MVHLTIEGTSYKVDAVDWFYFDGRLQSAPDWFLDALDDNQAVRFPTGAVTFVKAINGQPIVYPGSLVFRKLVKWGDKHRLAISSLICERPDEETTASLSRND